MKNLFILLQLLLISFQGNSQEIPSTFVNYERMPTDNPLFDYDERISSIHFTTDKDFEFWSRPMVSCLTWKEYKGTWVSKNDTIIFSDQFEVHETDSKFQFSNQEANEFYLLKFKTDKNSNLQNKKIEVQFVYDFDSEFDDVKLDTVLDQNANLKIPYYKIPNQNKLASIRFEIHLENKEKRYNYITEYQTVNKKTKDLPNQITIILIEHPKKEIVYRTTKALYFDHKLKVISTEKTKSIYDDFLENLLFKDFYEFSKF